MILYTPLPLEQVFQGIEEIRAPEEVIHNGITMQVERLEGQMARIVRILSPEPSHYLNPAMAPGSVIRL